ncbi:hypothetical protein M8J75_002089 [Diaphorina citri]|nr:hypothetical protein M8J75_002089 [Diaphorina citri]
MVLQGVHQDVSFHYFGPSADGDKYQMTLMKLLDRSKIGTYSLVSKEFGFEQEPMLRNKAVLVNQKHNRVREGKEFILSCVAEGSRFIQFHWFKDRVPINVNYSMREMWIKRSGPDSQHQYISTLGIQSAHKLDQGRFTCQVTDLGYQQCLGVDVEVLSTPEVRISPVSVTLEKGSDLTIKCMSPDEINFGNTSDRFGYSWIKDGDLFPMHPDQEMWEDLEPGGSVLTVRNIQKSVTYSCLVTAPHVPSSQASSSIYLLTPSRPVPLCPTHHSYGLAWPPMLNGQTAHVETISRCLVSRQCTLVNNAGPARWETEDFSACVPPTLYTIETNFKSLTLGYQTTSINLTLQHTADYLSSVPVQFPGQTESTVSLLSNILRFLQHTSESSWNFMSSSGILGASEYFYIIINYLLYWEQTLPIFVHRQKVMELQGIIEVWSLLWCNQLSGPHKRLLLESLLIDVRKLYNLTSSYISVHQPSVLFKNSLTTWSPNTTVTFESSTPMSGSKGVLNLVIISYANLSQYLAPRYVDHATDLLYEVHSSVVSTCLGDNGVKQEPHRRGVAVKQLRVRVQFPRPSNQSIPVGWNLTCGVSHNYGVTWEVACHTQLSRTSVTCMCDTLGLHALLITLDKHQMLLSSSSVSHLRLLVGFSSCILEVAITLLHILPRWFRRKTSWLLFLKTKMVGYLLLIQYLILVALSCHLGDLLIIYTHVTIHTHHFKNTKLCIVIILNVLSLLIILCLSLSTYHVTLVYYVCLASTCGYVLVFACFYVYITRYIRALRDAITSPAMLTALAVRQRILDKSAALTLALSTLYICALLFLSHPGSVALQYLLSLSAFLLGFALFLAYFVHSSADGGKSNDCASCPDSGYCDVFDMYMAEAGAEKEVNIGRCEGEGQEEEIPLTESHSGGKMVTFSHDLVRDSEPPDLPPSHTPTHGCDSLDILPHPPLTPPSPGDPLTTRVCVELRPPHPTEDGAHLALCNAQGDGTHVAPCNAQGDGTHLSLCSIQESSSVDNTGAAQRDVCSMTSALSTRSPRHPGLISFNPVRTVPYPSAMSVPYSTSPPVLYPSSLPPYSYTRVPVTNSKYPYPHTGAGDAGVIPSQIPYDETSRTVLDGHCGPNSYQVTNESHRKTQDRLSRGIASQTEQTHSSRRNSDTRSCDQRNLDCRNSDQRNLDSRNSDQRNLDSRNSDQTNSDSRNSDQRDCDGICDQNNSDRKTSDSICDERQQPSPLVSRFLKTSANTALDFREFPQGVSPLDNCVNNNYNNSQYPTNNNHPSHCNDNCVHSPRKGVSYSTNPSLYSSNPHSSIHSASNPLVPHTRPNNSTSHYFPNHNTPSIASHTTPSARLPQRAFLQSVNPSNNSTSQATKDPTRVKFPAQSPNRQTKALPANANTKLISPNSQTSHKVPNQSIPTGHSGSSHPDPHMSTDRKYPATRHNLTNNVNCDTNSILVDNLSDIATDTNVGRLMVDGVRIYDMKPADDAVSESTHAVSESTHADSSDSAIELDSNPNLSGAESTLTSGESTLTSGESTLTSGESTLTSGESTLTSGESTVTSGDSNKELMTQISNDLDYLLNTHEDYTPRSLKRNRKGSSPSGGAKMKMSPGHLARHTALAGGVMRNTADLVTTSKK